MVKSLLVLAALVAGLALGLWWGLLIPPPAPAGLAKVMRPFAWACTLMTLGLLVAAGVAWLV
jgi:hypothetical protein